MNGNIKRKGLRVRAIVLSLSMILTMFAFDANTVYAGETVSGPTLPLASYNLSNNLIKSSSLTVTEDGYMRVFYDGKKIYAENYDKDFNIYQRTEIEKELPIWGGFYAGTDAYYIVVGQNNEEESDTKEVIRVIKYNKEWERLGAAEITSGNNYYSKVRYPFDYGCVEFTECNGTLYIATAHEGYVDEQYGQGHQGFLMVAVDVETMTGEIILFDLWHSFAQYIESDDDNLYLLEQSEGSRYTLLSKFASQTLEATEVPVLEYGGQHTSAWSIPCYASVDDMAVSQDNVLGIGTSIDQDKYDEITESTSHNIYLTVTPKEDFTKEATTVKWLTEYIDDGKTFVGLKITKVNGDKFLVSWEESPTSPCKAKDTNDALSGYILHYVFIDGNGNKIGEEKTVQAAISDCHPVVDGEDVVYYASSSNMVNFYKIDTLNGVFSTKSYRVAGEKATWGVSDNELIIYGEGVLSVGADENNRSPLSTCSAWYGGYVCCNTWQPLEGKVKKIVIEGGITEIGEGYFKEFESIEDVIIKPGTIKIGKEAFAFCDNLNWITIPSTVTSIGKDILWTGYTWYGSGGHVVNANIRCESGSKAEAYAKENNIPYEYTNPRKSIAKASVSGISSKTYTGKLLTQNITVKLGTKRLTKNVDYKVTYSKNKNVGTARVTITGIGAYKGTITREFKIRPKGTNQYTTYRYKGALKVRWSKQTSKMSTNRIYGYQIAYSTKSSFAGVKYKYANGYSKTSYKISKLKKKSYYYVKVRTRMKVNGKWYYSNWSKVIKVKTK